MKRLAGSGFSLLFATVGCAFTPPPVWPTAKPPVAAGAVSVAVQGWPRAATDLSLAPSGAYFAVGGPAEARLFEASSGRFLRALFGRDLGTTRVAAGDTRVVTAGGRSLAVFRAADGALLAHHPRTGDVRALALSPDEAVAAVAIEASIELVTLEGGATRLLPPPGGAVTALAFSPTAQLLAVASEDEMVHLYDTATGQRLTRLGGSIWARWFGIGGHTAPVVGVAFDRGGQRLATRGRDQTIRVWSAADGGLEATIETLATACPTCLAFSADGAELTAGGAQGSLDVFDPATGEKRRERRAEGLFGLAVPPTGRAVIVAGANVERIELDAGDVAWRHAPVDPAVASIRLGMGTLFVGEPSGRVARLDLTSGERRELVGAATAAARALAIDQYGERLVSLRGDGATLFGRDGATPLVDEAGAPATGDDVAFAANGKLLAVRGAKLALFDGERGRFLRALGDLGPEGERGSVAVSPDGRQVAVSSKLHLAVFDPIAGAMVLRSDQHTDRVAFASDGKVYAAGSGLVAVHPVGSEAAARRIEHPGLTALAASPSDPDLVFVGGAEGEVFGYDAKTGHERWRARPGRAKIVELTASAGGHLLAALGADGAIELLRAADGAGLGTLFWSAEGPVYVTSDGEVDGPGLALHRVRGLTTEVLEARTPGLLTAKIGPVAVGSCCE